MACGLAGGSLCRMVQPTKRRIQCNACDAGRPIGDRVHRSCRRWYGAAFLFTGQAVGQSSTPLVKDMMGWLASCELGAMGSFELVLRYDSCAQSLHETGSLAAVHETSPVGCPAVCLMPRCATSTSETALAINATRSPGRHVVLWSVSCCYLCHAAAGGRANTCSEYGAPPGFHLRSPVRMFRTLPWCFERSREAMQKW